MHEHSLARALYDRGISRRDFLKFCTTMAATLALPVSFARRSPVVPLGGFCRECRKPFEVEELYVTECPLCGSSSFRIDQGRELELVEIEVL